MSLVFGDVNNDMANELVLGYFTNTGQLSYKGKLLTFHGTDISTSFDTSYLGADQCAPSYTSSMTLLIDQLSNNPLYTPNQLIAAVATSGFQCGSVNLHVLLVQSPPPSSGPLYTDTSTFPTNLPVGLPPTSVALLAGDYAGLNINVGQGVGMTVINDYSVLAVLETMPWDTRISTNPATDNTMKFSIVTGSSQSMTITNTLGVAVSDQLGGNLELKGVTVTASVQSTLETKSKQFQDQTHTSTLGASGNVINAGLMVLQAQTMYVE